MNWRFALPRSARCGGVGWPSRRVFRRVRSGGCQDVRSLRKLCGLTRWQAPGGAASLSACKERPPGLGRRTWMLSSRASAVKEEPAGTGPSSLWHSRETLQTRNVPRHAKTSPERATCRSLLSSRAGASLVLSVTAVKLYQLLFIVPPDT